LKLRKYISFYKYYVYVKYFVDIDGRMLKIGIKKNEGENMAHDHSENFDSLVHVLQMWISTPEKLRKNSFDQTAEHLGEKWKVEEVELAKQVALSNTQRGFL